MTDDIDLMGLRQGITWYGKCEGPNAFLAVNYENDISLILMALYWPPSHVFQTRFIRIAWVEDAGGRGLRWIKFSSQWSDSSMAHSSVSASLYTRGRAKMELSSVTEVGLMIWSLCLFHFLHYFRLRSKCYSLHRARALWEYRHQGAMMTSSGDVKTTGGLLIL